MLVLRFELRHMQDVLLFFCSSLAYPGSHLSRGKSVLGGRIVIAELIQLKQRRVRPAICIRGVFYGFEKVPLLKKNERIVPYVP